MMNSGYDLNAEGSNIASLNDLNDVFEMLVYHNSFSCNLFLIFIRSKVFTDNAHDFVGAPWCYHSSLLSLLHIFKEVMW